MTKRKYNKIRKKIMSEDELTLGLYGLGLWKILSKIYNEKEKYLQISKGLQISDKGSILHTITYRNNDISETILFVPGLKVRVKNMDIGSFNYLTTKTDKDNE